MKIKIISLIIAILIISMYVPVFAETPIPDPPYGAYDYWVVTDSYGTTTLYTSPNPISVKYNSTGKLVLYIINEKKYVLSGGNWSYDKEMIGKIHAGFNTIYASNHNIAYSDGSGFFFTPPKVSELCQIVRQMKIKGTFGTILKNFSAGLIPILGVIVLFIAFRKSWAILQNLLMH